MNIILQSDPAWGAARIGKVTASRMADLTAKTKTGFGAGRANYMAELIAEQLTGVAAESYINAAMQHGIDTEAEARTAYEFHTDTTVELGGFVQHPGIDASGASPDGFIGEDGLLEIKCPNTATHIDTLLSGSIPDKYIKQMQWQIACAARPSPTLWCDFVSYDPRMPESMRLFIKRVPRDNAMIAELETAVRQFLVELETKLHRLKGHYEPVPKPRRHWSELSLPEQAGIRCQDAEFGVFLVTRDGDTNDDNATIVRRLCGVKSRAELGTDDAAAERWVSLNREYENWKHGT